MNTKKRAIIAIKKICVPCRACAGPDFFFRVPCRACAGAKIFFLCRAVPCRISKFFLVPCRACAGQKIRRLSISELNQLAYLTSAKLQNGELRDLQKKGELS